MGASYYNQSYGYYKTYGGYTDGQGLYHDRTYSLEPKYGFASYSNDVYGYNDVNYYNRSVNARYGFVDTSYIHQADGYKYFSNTYYYPIGDYSGAGYNPDKRNCSPPSKNGF